MYCENVGNYSVLHDVQCTYQFQASCSVAVVWCFVLFFLANPTSTLLLLAKCDICTMAKTMPAPWVLNIVTELLKDPAQEGELTVPQTGRPRVVQVLKVHEKENILIVNDKKHSVAVFLSQQCVDSFMKASNQSISSLESSMIKAEKWHFSTTIQCLGEWINDITHMQHSRTLSQYFHLHKSISSFFQKSHILN